MRLAEQSRDAAPTLHAADALFGCGVVGVDCERALVALKGLRATIKLLQREAALGPAFGVPVIDVERGIEILDRLLMLPDDDETLAPGRIRSGDEGITVDGSVEVGDRLAVPTHALVYEAARVQALGGFGRKSNRL